MKVAADDRDVAIMERVKKGQIFPKTAIAMILEHVKNLFFNSKQPNVEDYKAKKKLERVQLKAKKELKDTQLKEEKLEEKRKLKAKKKLENAQLK